MIVLHYARCIQKQETSDLKLIKYLHTRKDSIELSSEDIEDEEEEILLMPK